MNFTPLIHIRDISKSYGGVRALSSVSMEISRGEVHALCGENGAGKSTLIKILTGSVTPDHGTISMVAPSASSESSSSSALRQLKLGDVRASESAGIAVIHQESVAFPHLSAFDNIFVGREPRRFAGLLLNRGRMRSETRSLTRNSFRSRVPNRATSTRAKRRPTPQRARAERAERPPTP